jgi:hypothetical protein
MVMLRRSLDAALGVEDAVAIVADTRDPIGEALARALVERVPELDVDKEAGRANDRGEIPTLVAVFPLNVAIELMESPSPIVSAALAERPQRGRVRVVVVGGGGSTLLQIPVDHLPDIGVA